MSEKINTNQGDTDVKNKIIDFSTLETEDRADDMTTWNAMQLFGEDDGKEAKYQSPEQASEEALRRLKSAKIGAKIFGVFNTKIA